jgi:aspartate racemase
MKTVGIIGGIGPESTIEYYRFVIDEYRQRRPDGTNPSIVINSVDVNKLVRWMTSGEHEAVANYLIEGLERLQRAGVDFAVVAANTPHIVFNQVRSRTALPLISIVEATRDKAQSMGVQRPALLGTRFTMEAKFYPEAFAPADIPIIVPNQEERAFIHEKYMGELLNGLFLPETRTQLIRIVEQMKEREGIDALILGGTELPLILRDAQIQGVVFLDTTRIHVDAIVDELLRKKLSGHGQNRLR